MEGPTRSKADLKIRLSFRPGIYNTWGFNCEKCLQGYFGDPLRLPKGDCKPCECHVQGTMQSQYQKQGKNYETALMCDQNTGQCNCKSYVWGRQCKCRGESERLSLLTVCQQSSLTRWIVHAGLLQHLEPGRLSGL